MVRTGSQLSELPKDMVIKATGQAPFEGLVNTTGIEHTKGKISVSPNGLSSIPGVFAGGDDVNGGKEVVDAVQAGKISGKAILNYLFQNQK